MLLWLARWLFRCEFCFWVKVNVYSSCSRVDLCGFISPKITFWKEILNAESHLLRFFFFFVWICTLNCIWLIGVCTVYCCVYLKSKSPQLLLVNNCFVVESHCQSCCVLHEVWKSDCAPGVLIALKSRFACFPLLPFHNERGMLGYLTTRFSFLGCEQKCWLCSGLLGIPRVQVQPLQHPLENKPFELGKSLVLWPL